VPAGRLTDVRLVAIAGALTVLLAGVGALLSPKPDAGGGDGSSFSAGALGGKAAFETLKALGHHAERSLEPATALSADPGGTVLIVTGAMAASEQDKRALQAFLAAGGTVLTVGAMGADFLGVVWVTSGSDPLAAPATYRVVAASPLVAGAEEITMATSPATHAFPAAYVPLFAIAADEPLVTTARIGSGRAVWLAASTPLTNQHIRSARNLQLLLNVVGTPGERRILWDEHYHGFSRSLWSYAAATPLPWAVAQLGLLAAAALATFSRRRLPVRPRADDVRTSPMEFIEMLQVLYARSGGAPSAVRSARSRFRRRVATMAGLSSDAADDVIARAAARRCSATGDELSTLLDTSRAAAEGSPLDATAALTLTARLQQLSAELAGPDSGGRTPDSGPRTPPTKGA
jgi:hypothetical protein